MAKTVSIEGGIYFDTDVSCAILGWSQYTFIRGSLGEPGDYTNKIPVVPYTLVVEVPDDFDPRAGQIAALQEQKREAAAKYTAMVTEIDRRISELQAIEFSEAA